jgi:hypothetical protein
MHTWGRDSRRWLAAILVALVAVSLAPALAPAAGLGPAAVLAQTCSPRPPVGVSVTPAGNGRLQATFTATTNASIPSNRLIHIALQSATNAMVDTPLEIGKQPPLTLTMPPATQQYTIFVYQTVPGQGATVNLVVADQCGDWPTFVGGGANAFAAPPPSPRRPRQRA